MFEELLFQPIGVYEGHDVGYKIHDRKFGVFLKYAFPATIQQIRGTPNRTPFTTNINQ